MKGYKKGGKGAIIVLTGGELPHSDSAPFVSDIAEVKGWSILNNRTSLIS
jgi:hypothetical protein